MLWHHESAWFVMIGLRRRRRSDEGRLDLIKKMLNLRIVKDMVSNAFVLAS